MKDNYKIQQKTLKMLLRVYHMFKDNPNVTLNITDIHMKVPMDMKLLKYILLCLIDFNLIESEDHDFYMGQGYYSKNRCKVYYLK